MAYEGVTRGPEELFDRLAWKHLIRFEDDDKLVANADLASLDESGATPTSRPAAGSTGDASFGLRGFVIPHRDIRVGRVTRPQSEID
jgi:hypothetical protein